MTEFAAGKEVLSHCGKCKLALGHTIVSMKDTATIGKVTCNTCGATHNYKDPASKTKRVKSKSTRKSTKRTVSVGQFWMEEMSKASGKARAYSIRELFDEGEIIDHKSFGPGIVQKKEEDKIEVLFQHEIKLLVHGK